MSYHMSLAAKEIHEHDGNKFELAVYRTEKDGYLRGYISSGGFNQHIVEISAEVASDLAITGSDSVSKLISVMKDEINAGKFPLLSNT